MNKLPRVFVTRDLSSISPIRKVCEGRSELEYRSLIDISCMALHQDLSSYTWIFFYSRNGVRCYVKQHRNSNTAVKYGALGSGTAHEMSLHGISPDFIGDGDSLTTAAAFAQVLDQDGDSILFLRASQSKDTMFHSLKESCTCDSRAIYNNTPSERIPADIHDIFVCTSSMNAEVYTSLHPLRDTMCLAIGEPTRHTLQRLGAGKIYVSETATEASLAEILDDILKKY